MLFIFADAPRFEDAYDLGAEHLIKNGEGIRSFLWVDVYEAALYLKAKSADPASVMADKNPRVLRMRFLRNMSGAKLKEKLAEAFEKNCADTCETFKPQMDEVLKQIQDTSKGEEIVYVLENSHVEIKFNQQRLSIKKPGFDKLLLSLWIGKIPPSENFKKGLLGRH